MLDMQSSPQYKERTPQEARTKPGGHIGDMMRLSDADIAVNLLSTGAVPTKHYVASSMGFERTSYPMIRDWLVGDGVDMSSVAAMLRTLKSLQHSNAVIIRGAPLARHTAPVRRNNKMFADCPRRWACIDVDDAHTNEPDWMPGRDAEADQRVLSRLVQDVLPREWHDVGFVAQWSASAGFIKEDGRYHPGCAGGIKVHLWFLLDQPVDSALLREYLKARAPRVDAMVARQVQPHYVVNPIIDMDPVANRVVAVWGEERVALSDPLRILAREMIEKREARQANVAEYVKLLPGLDGERLAEYADRQVKLAVKRLEQMCAGPDRHGAIIRYAQLLGGLAADPRCNLNTRAIRMAIMYAVPDKEKGSLERAIRWGIEHAIDRSKDLVRAGGPNQEDGVPQGARSIRLKESDLVQGRYLPAVAPTSNVVLMRGPQGVGKTYWLKDTAMPALRARHPDARVVYITHRRSMASQGCKRLGLPDYREGKGSIHTDVSICVDSLYRINLEWNTEQKFIILLDESEQVIRHLARGGTMNAEGRLRAHNAWRSVFDRAAAVVCMDADLSTMTVKEMDYACPHLGPCADEAQMIRVDLPMKYEYKVSNTKNDVLGKLVETYEKGNKVAVACQSRADAETIAQMLQTLDPQRKVGLVTSRTLLQDEGKVANQDPTRYATECEALVYSPSWGTAVSVEASGYTIFGFGCMGVGTSSDLLQQLHRVRNPVTSEITVYLPKGGKANERTEQDIINQCLSRGDWTRRMIKMYLPGIVLRSRVQLTDQEMAERYARVTVHQRHWGGDGGMLGDAFCTLVRHRGGHLDVVEELTSSPRVDVTEAKVVAADLQKSRWSKDVSAAPVIEKAIQEPSTYQEQCSQEQKELRDFYSQEVTPQLVLDDNGGQRRTKLRLLSDVMLAQEGLHAALSASDAQTSHSGAITHQSYRTVRALTIASAVRAAGLCYGSWMECRTEQNANTVRLGMWLDVHRQKLDLLNMSYDDKSTPMRWLSGIMRRMGLKLISRRVRVEGKQHRIYMLDDNHLAESLGLVSRYHALAKNRGPKDITEFNRSL